MIGGGGMGNGMTGSRVPTWRERENNRLRAHRRRTIADEAGRTVEPDGTTYRKDCIGDIDDSEKFQSDSDGEAELSSAPSLSNMDVAGPSVLIRQDSNGRANGKLPCTSLVEEYVGMGFPEEMVIKGIKEIGHSDENKLLELLLTYKTLANDDVVGNCSLSSFIPQRVEDYDDLIFEKRDGNNDVDGRETNSNGSDDEYFRKVSSIPLNQYLPPMNQTSRKRVENDFLRDMSEKDKIKSLVEMGFPKDDAKMALTRCGVDTALSVLVDSVYASQAAGDFHSGNLSEYEVSSRFLDSFGGRKKEILMEEIEKKRKRYGGGAKLMVGFNLPGDRQRSVTRRLPNKQANGPPFFYFENVVRAPKGVWETFSRFLYDIEPETVDSLHFCATARKRGYIHNLPIGNRFPLRPLPPKTIFEAFPHYKKWWPSWDCREQLNCLLTSVASAELNERIHCALASSSDPPPPNVQNYVMHECRKGNLVWVGKNKVAPLEPNEMEYLLGFPRDHTRGVGNTKRYQCLGNSFQVDTVAYHLSVLKDIFPNGVNVLSLFTGIGGGEVALHRLGIHMRAVVSVEICEVNRRILRGWWDQTQTGTLIEIDDVKTLNDDMIASFVSRFGGFDLVIGGSPCNNLAGRNRHTRNGLEGEKSFLFHHYSRILSAVKLAMGR